MQPGEMPAGAPQAELGLASKWNHMQREGQEHQIHIPMASAPAMIYLSFLILSFPFIQTLGR